MTPSNHPNSSDSVDTLEVLFEPTPNPATMKFILPFIVSDNSFNCGSVQEAQRSPLAYKIFGFPWTQSVFIGSDFITVTKQDWVEWEHLAAPLAGLIQEHLRQKEPVVTETDLIPEELDILETDSELIKNIKLTLHREIRPVVALDGGDVVFDSFENGVLYLQMLGSCSGCPSSSATLKQGIEVRLKEIFPEIKSVESAAVKNP